MDEDIPLSGAVASIAKMAAAGPTGVHPSHSTDSTTPPGAAAAADSCTNSCSCTCHRSSVAADAAAPDPVVDISTEFLGQQLDDFIMGKAKKMVAEAKRLLPGALEHATRGKAAALAELKGKYEDAKQPGLAEAVKYLSNT